MGASKTCISVVDFDQLYPRDKPRPIKSEHGKELQGAGGSVLGLQGIFHIPLKIMNRTISHEVITF